MKVIRSSGKHSQVYHRPLAGTTQPACAQGQRGGINWLAVDRAAIQATYRPCADCF